MFNDDKSFSLTTIASFRKNLLMQSHWVEDGGCSGKGDVLKWRPSPFLTLTFTCTVVDSFFIIFTYWQ